MTSPVRLVSATCAVFGLACAAPYTAVLLPCPIVGLATWGAWGVLGFLAARLLAGRVAALHLVSVPPAAAAVLVGCSALQNRLAVTRGGIYQDQFRVHTGHGGPEWSSAHTRGWVDESSHRAAELVLNTAQQTSGDRTSLVHVEGTFAHFRDTQRLTAGYLVFFFDTVGYRPSGGTS